MTAPVADFTGYATRNDMVCTDGRTILRDAFKDNDGQIVPLVWQHSHDNVEDVLGHAILENVEDGVKAHAFFNKTAKGQHAKEVVRHGDVKWLSIFANQLVERAKNVAKGNIREVSLVLAGANPGATILATNMAHSDDIGDYVLDEAEITTGIAIEITPEPALAHADTATATDTSTDTSTDTADNGQNDLEQILSTLTEDQQIAVNYLLTQALTANDNIAHSDTDADDDTADDEDVDADDTTSDEDADSTDDENSDDSDDSESDDDAEDDESADADETDDSSTEADADSEADADTTTSDTNEAGDAVQHDNTNQEDTSMTHNAFDQAKNSGGGSATGQITLSRDDVSSIMHSVVKNNSTLETELSAYALQHGIENIEYLFPDAQTLENSPAWLARRVDWVDKVLNAVRKAPFSRIRSITADLTPDEARAKGYITGNMKNEEFFELSKRETTPQTVYKKQKLNRDDVIDITSLDVVAWLKAEMKMMLDEEIASAILIGDGRSSGDEEKIKEANVRPIASDAELYTTTFNVNLDDANSSAEEIVDAAIDAREFWKGTGQPTFYTTPRIIAMFKRAKDGNGQRYYKSNADIAAMLDVADVVPVETMVRVPDLIGIMVNLNDYSIGRDNGGQATMFDDFDLNYNKLIYLLETRLSGALTVPKAAIAFRKTTGTNTLVAPDSPAFNKATGVLTVPTKTGVVYKNDSNATLTTGAPVTVAAGASYHVTATPASGYYFADNAHDEWTFVADAS